MANQPVEAWSSGLKAKPAPSRPAATAHSDREPAAGRDVDPGWRMERSPVSAPSRTGHDGGRGHHPTPMIR